MNTPSNPTRPLIASDRVEGTVVYDQAGNQLGSIRRLMIGKLNGQVAYAIVSFGGFIGLAEGTYRVPWAKLKYDTNLSGYRTDITETELRQAPPHAREGSEAPTAEQEDELHAYFRIPPDWRAF
jgi:PRC-barrel domain